MIVAGLTGGIATGKSTAARMLAQAGADVLDADAIAREAVRKGRPAWQQVVHHFGKSLLQPDGEIDRVRLAEIVFNDPEQRRFLERIIHPRVFARLAQQTTRLAREKPQGVVIHDIPLLFEAGMEPRFEEIIVVYAAPTIQLQRLMRRDRLPREAAMARIRAQMPIDEKKRRATRVIDNSGTLTETRRQVMSLYGSLCAGARSAGA